MARYSDTIRDERTLAPVGGAQVFVRNQDGSTPVITADDGTPLFAAVSDEYGTFSFNAAPNLYDLTIRYNGRVIGEEFGVPVGAPSLPTGFIVDALGTSPTTAPSQRAVSDAVTGINGTLAGVTTGIAQATWNNVGNFSPTLTLGGLDQSPSLENGQMTGHLDLTANQAFIQIAGTARDKTAPAGGFGDNARVLLEDLPFTANGIIPQWLKLEPGSGFPADTEAYLVGDTIAFYRPGRVPVTANDLADNYYIRVTGTVAILPPEETA